MIKDKNRGRSRESWGKGRERARDGRNTVGTFGAWHYNPINLQTGLAITELGPNTGSDINNHYNLIAMNLQTSGPSSRDVC